MIDYLDTTLDGKPLDNGLLSPPDEQPHDHTRHFDRDRPSSLPDSIYHFTWLSAALSRDLKIVHYPLVYKEMTSLIQKLTVISHETKHITTSRRCRAAHSSMKTKCQHLYKTKPKAMLQLTW